MSFPLLKIQENTSVLGLSLALVLYMARLISLFITPGTHPPSFFPPRGELYAPAELVETIRISLKQSKFGNKLFPAWFIFGGRLPQTRGVFSTVLLKSVAVCLYASGREVKELLGRYICSTFSFSRRTLRREAGLVDASPFFAPPPPPPTSVSRPKWLIAAPLIDVGTRFFQDTWVPWFNRSYTILGPMRVMGRPWHVRACAIRLTLETGKTSHPGPIASGGARG